MTDDEFQRKVDELPGIQLPRVCEFDGNMMARSDRGIRCSKCGHEIFDTPGASGRSENPDVCHCFNCFQKAQGLRPTRTA
jgi:hypothetical protein